MRASVNPRGGGKGGHRRTLSWGDQLGNPYPRRWCRWLKGTASPAPLGLAIFATAATVAGVAVTSLSGRDTVTWGTAATAATVAGVTTASALIVGAGTGGTPARAPCAGSPRGAP